MGDLRHFSMARRLHKSPAYNGAPQGLGGDTPMRAASLTRLVIAAAVAGSTLALPASAAAQWRDRDDRGWNDRVGGEAYQRGFRDGQRLGDDDARRGRGFNVQDHREYRE